MTLPSQLVFRKIHLQSMLNFVHSYKATSDFSDDEVGKNSHLFVHMVYIGTLSPVTHIDDA